MKYIKIVVLVIGLSAGIYKSTYAESQTLSNNTTTNSKAVKEISKDKMDAANTAKVRKVSPSENNGFENKAEVKVNITATTSTTTTESPSTDKKILAEGGGRVNIKVPSTKVNNTKEVAKGDTEKIVTAEESTNSSLKKIDAPAISNDKQILKHQNKNNITETITATKNLTSSSTSSPPEIATNSTTNLASLPTINKTASTTSTTTTTTTTTTTAPSHKPKKPTITFGVEDFPDLEKNSPELQKIPQSSSSKLPIPLDAPYTQPSQEFNNNFHHGRDYILPIVSMLFIIPLVIGILITSYRRFRDCWSTRHYRRMDFLVDGMYND